MLCYHKHRFTPDKIWFIAIFVKRLCEIPGSGTIFANCSANVGIQRNQPYCEDETFQTSEGFHANRGDRFSVSKREGSP
jgi:hypothetical protein